MNIEEIKQSVIETLQNLETNREGEAVLGISPLVFAGVDPGNQITDHESAYTFLQGIFDNKDLRQRAVLAVNYAKAELMQRTDAPFVYILNSLGQEVLLWEFALYAEDFMRRWEAQQTLLNYIAYNENYPYAGGLDGVEEAALGLKRRVRVASKRSKIVKVKPLRKITTVLHSKETSHQKEEMFFDIINPRQRDYAVFGTFMGALSLVLLNKSVK